MITILACWAFVAAIELAIAAFFVRAASLPLTVEQRRT